MESFYRFIANVLLITHFAYVAFVVFGFAAILVGIARRKPWARSPLLRWSHLIAILIVSVESLLAITCPLTVWEQQLRKLSGQASYEGDFIAVWLHRLMFFDLPEWAFIVAYLSFGLAVLLVFIVWPPRRRNHAMRL